MNVDLEYLEFLVDKINLFQSDLKILKECQKTGYNLTANTSAINMVGSSIGYKFSKEKAKQFIDREIIEIEQYIESLNSKLEAYNKMLKHNQ